MKRTFQKGAALCAGCAVVPCGFLALADAERGAGQAERGKTVWKKQIEQAEQRQEDAATMKELYLQKANSILAQLDVLNEQIRQQKAQVDQENSGAGRSTASGGGRAGGI